MIFTVDVGNTNIVIGVFNEDKLKFHARIATETSKTEDQYAVEFNNIFTLNGASPKDIKGAIISSVVPRLIPVLKNSTKKLFGCKPLCVGPGLKTGLEGKRLTILPFWR